MGNPASFLVPLSMVFTLLQLQGQVDMVKLKKDPDITGYKKVTADIAYKTRSDYYHIPRDPALRQQLLKTAGNPDEMKKVYRSYGMKNADEYVDELQSQLKYMASFAKHHPELNTLSPQQKTDILRQILIN